MEFTLMPTWVLLMMARSWRCKEFIGFLFRETCVSGPLLSLLIWSALTQSLTGSVVG